MKLTGKENTKLCIEINGKENWVTYGIQHTLDELLTSYILGSIVIPLDTNDKIEEQTVKYLCIGNTIIDKRCRINAKFRISIKDKRYYECACTYLDISDFFNFIVDLYIKYVKISKAKITDIEIKMIEIEIKYPLSFTDKGFINTLILKEYDLDTQINILLHLLKSQKWEIINNKIIFTELIDNKYIKKLLNYFKKESIINTEKQKYIIANDCNTLGIQTVMKNAQRKIKREKNNKEKLEVTINTNKEFYSHNFKKYIPKFTNLGDPNNRKIVIMV